MIAVNNYTMAERTVANLYGVKGMYNIHSWYGLASFMERYEKVRRCEKYNKCEYDKKHIKCKKIIKRKDIVLMQESRFQVSETVAEKVIDVLLTRDLVHAFRCSGAAMIYFDE